MKLWLWLCHLFPCWFSPFLILCMFDFYVDQFLRPKLCLNTRAETWGLIPPCKLHPVAPWVNHAELTENIPNLLAWAVSEKIFEINAQYKMDSFIIFHFFTTLWNIYKVLKNFKTDYQINLCLPNILCTQHSFL